MHCKNMRVVFETYIVCMQKTLGLFLTLKPSCFCSVADNISRVKMEMII